jgi:hypothetical protein
MIRVCEQDLLELLRKLEILWRLFGNHIEKRNSESYMFVIKESGDPFVRSGSVIQKFIR